MNTTSPSASRTLLNIFLEPRKAFGDIRGHNGWLWYPLLLTIAISVLIFAWYYGTADWSVVQQQIMDYIAGRNYTADQLEQIRNGLTRSGIITQTVIFTVLAVFIIYLVQALYLFLVSKVAGYETQGFGQWFSFTSWAYFPGVIAYVVIGISYLVSGHQANLLNLDVTSLNTLMFQLPPSHAWFALVNSLHLTTFWIFGLMILGFAQWTRQSLGKSAVITLAPYVLIYGVWILIKLI